MAVLMLSDSECRTAASQNNSNYGHQNTHISSQKSGNAVAAMLWQPSHRHGSLRARAGNRRA
jgi:hypothetical protein